jgi:hypothetical protein
LLRKKPLRQLLQSTHSLVQDFFFGETLMLRRHDYSVNVACGFRASQPISDYVEASGIYLRLQDQDDDLHFQV